MVRRAGALAVVVLVVLAAVRLVGAATSGDGASADTDTPASSVAVRAGAGSTSRTTTADGQADPAPSTSATRKGRAAVSTTTLPDRTGSPTAANPARVYVVGDSDAGTFGPYLERLLDATGLVETELNYKVSSGLSRPDFFDWPAELEQTLPAVNADIVVATFGGNDAQGLAVESGEFIIGDPVANEAEWTEEYQRRVGEVMDLLLEDDRAVIWVGIPNDDNPDVTARMAIQDRAAKAAAAERPDVVFIDTWTRFSGRDGGWAEFVIDPRDGAGKDVRAGDGFHLNETGAEILAIDIAQAVRDELRDLGADI